MQKLNLQGTPSLVLIDKAGEIRLTHFGRLSDMQVGNMIGQLLMEGAASPDSVKASDAKNKTPDEGQCDADGCRS